MAAQLKPPQRLADQIPYLAPLPAQAAGEAQIIQIRHLLRLQRAALAVALQQAIQELLAIRPLHHHRRATAVEMEQLT